MLALAISILPISFVSCDSPEPWQFGFQDGASPMQEGITELHDSIFFYLVIILFGVMWALSSVIVNFHSSKSQIVYKYANHGTLIELIWTITPALVLIAIAFPSFRLLYLADINMSEIDFAIIYSAFHGKVSNNKLVVYDPNKVGNSLGVQRANGYTLSSIKCSSDRKSQIVGHLLGDATIAIPARAISPYFVFSQSTKRFDYLWHVFIKLMPYYVRFPKVQSLLRKSTVTSIGSISTRSFPFIKDLHELFYKQNETGKWVKVITPGLLNHLDAIALAY